MDLGKKVLESWGPGRFDAELDKDGKAFRPDGKQAGTLIPPAFGLAGVNLHTWTGFGSVPYWNAFVAVTEMHGSGVYVDARLKDAAQFPVAARSGSWDTRGTPDKVTAKLAALHSYQPAIPAPRPPAGSFDARAFVRGKALFEGKARCATCHVPPLYTEPGHNLHTPSEIGVDAFQADRSPPRPVDAPKARLLSRRALRDASGRCEPLRRVLQPRPHGAREKRPDPASARALAGRGRHGESRRAVTSSPCWRREAEGRPPTNADVARPRARARRR